MSTHDTTDQGFINAVLRRDGLRCRICNSPDELVVHRRSHAEDHPVTTDDFTTLCVTCHGFYHIATAVRQPPGYEKVHGG